MTFPDSNAACVIKPMMLLIDSVVVTDWIPESVSVTQSEFADVLYGNHKSTGKCT